MSRKVARRLAPPLALLALTGCNDGGSPDIPQVPTTSEPQAAPFAGSMPVLLTSRGTGALEAIVAGTLVKRGPCLYLDSAPEAALIVWGEDVILEEDAKRVWVAVDRGTGARFSIGDRIRGGGGALPSAQPISDFTLQPVPEECATGAAVQVHSVEVVETVQAEDPSFLPPPPPPPPPSPPSVIDSVRELGGETQGDPAVVSGLDDPRAALFVHVLEQYRSQDSFGPRPACLREADEAMIARVSARQPQVFGAAQCHWVDGGVKLRATGEAAVFVDARIECDGSQCLGEGGATYGNLGGHGYGYVIQPVRGGWWIARSGIMWMS